MSKEAIVNKILSEAEIRAKSFVEEQKDRADAIIAEAAEQCKNYYYADKYETEKAASDVAARMKTVAELDAKKIQLAAKRKIIDDVFSLALKKTVALDAEVMKKLLVGMLKEAEDGDVIVLGKRQTGMLTREDVATVARARDINLTLSDAEGSFDGMVISGRGVDKNLTFELEISLIREQKETEIAKVVLS